jgi:hypothetical protein
MLACYNTYPANARCPDSSGLHLNCDPVTSAVPLHPAFPTRLSTTSKPVDTEYRRTATASDHLSPSLNAELPPPSFPSSFTKHLFSSHPFSSQSDFAVRVPLLPIFPSHEPRTSNHPIRLKNYCFTHYMSLSSGTSNAPGGHISTPTHVIRCI